MSSTYLDLQREAEVAARLRADLGELLDEDDEQLVIDTIEGETELVEIICRALAENDRDEADALFLKQRIDQMAGRKARLEARMKARKRAVARAMLGAGLKKLPRPDFTVSAREGGFCVKVIDETLIPDGYWRVKRELDRKALAAAPNPVPGTELEQGEPILTVRRT